MRTDAALTRDTTRLLEIFYEAGRLNSLRDPVSLAAEAIDLSPPQIHALMWLHSDGALPMSVLAQRVSVTEKTVTGLIDRLERKGLVKRQHSTDDRRVVLVALTAAGRASARRLDEAMRKNVRDMLSLLPAADRRALLRIFANLTDRLRQLAGHRTPPQEPR